MNLTTTVADTSIRSTNLQGKTIQLKVLELSLELHCYSIHSYKTILVLHLELFQELLPKGILELFQELLLELQIQTNFSVEWPYRKANIFAR